MFTGIITHIGTINSISKNTLTVKVPTLFFKKISVGDSVSVNGICLTVVSCINASINFELMEETTKITNLGKLKKNDVVNLELPATANTFLSGHMVQGHVDCVGTIIKIKKKKSQTDISLRVPKNILKYLVDKNSVAVNGVSLTIIKVLKNGFTIGIIPHTNTNTNFKNVKVGDAVNIEVDMIAKYVYKFTI